MFTLLLVEDDAPIREMLRRYLGNDYHVLSAGDGYSALQILDMEKVDLMVLDWMLPDLDGPQILKRVRGNSEIKFLPVLMLTALSGEDEKIRGLDTGADDYMTKPVALKELDARIRALLRRSQGMDSQGVIEIGGLRLDPANHELQVRGELVDISPTEFRLLHYFMSKPDRLHTRTQLLDNVWGRSVYISDRTVDVHVLRLRKFLKKHQVDSRIKTVRGAGYRFRPKADE